VFYNLLTTIIKQTQETFLKINGNTILITGGATGIGFALAEVFLKEGNEVVICGRRKNRLQEAKEKLPAVHIRRCDIADPAERTALLKWTVDNFKNLNVLVNNAGIQRQIDFTNGVDEYQGEEKEIVINLLAPVHLSALFIPHLLRRQDAAIVNISSGLGFVPLAIMPVYCATKAALHSFSCSLRHQLRNTTVKVFEIIPPTVDTELDQGARAKRGQADRGIKPEEVAEATILGLHKDDYELAIGRADFLRMKSRNDPEGIFRTLNPS